MKQVKELKEIDLGKDEELRVELQDVPIVGGVFKTIYGRKTAKFLKHIWCNGRQSMIFHITTKEANQLRRRLKRNTIVVIVEGSPSGLFKIVKTNVLPSDIELTFKQNNVASKKKLKNFMDSLVFCSLGF